MPSTQKAIGRGRGRGKPDGATGRSSMPAPGRQAASSRRETSHSGDDRSAPDLIWDLSSPVGLDVSGESMPLAVRPTERAINGSPIDVKINYFELRFSFTGLIHLYEANFKIARGSKEIPPEEKRAVVWAAIEEVLGAQFDDRRKNVAYDAAKYLYATEYIDFGASEVGSDEGKGMSVKLPNEVGVSRFHLRISYVGGVKCDAQNPSQPLLAGQNATLMTLIDTVVHQRPCNHKFNNGKFTTVGNNFYQVPDQQNNPSINLNYRYSLYGAHVSTRHGLDGKLYINVNNANAVFYKPLNCVEFMIEAFNEHYNSTDFKKEQLNRNTELDVDTRDILRRYIKGLKVDMTYFKKEEEHKSRTRTVTKVGEAANKASFQLGEGGETVTVADYFAERRGIELQYASLPVLVFGSGKRQSSVPIELCSISPYQHSTRTLPEGATTIMIRKLCTPAPRRCQIIMDVANGSNLVNDEWSRSFKLVRNPQMTEVSGRVLDPPTLQHGNASIKPVDGVWAGRGAPPKMFEAKTIRGIVVVRLCRIDDRSITEAIGCLYRVAQQTGFNVQTNTEPVILDLDTKKLLDQFSNVLQPEVHRVKPSLVLVIMPGRNTQLYAAIKRFCDVDCGIACQCLLMKNCRPLKPMTAFNLLLKINVKLSGCNWLIGSNPTPDASERQLMELITNKRNMIIGLDVTHPGGRNQSIPSLAAMVGSLDNLSIYGASVRVSRGGVETITYIQNALDDLIVQHHNATGKRPDSIIVFRDGVAQNMFQEVLKQEYKAMKDYFDNRKEKVKITIVICQKRHSVRLFCQNEERGVGKSKNVPPGTIVDRDVVDFEHFDYYLCSHFGLQGTSRPCHYTVLHDDNKLSSDLIQRLSYYLCNVYARCTRSVGIPAPVYYADKVAERAKYHLMEFLNKISNMPYSESELGPAVLTQRQSLMEKLTKVADNVSKTMYFC